MSHASIPAEVRAARGLPDDLVRISVGIEEPEDLLEGEHTAFTVQAAAAPIQFSFALRKALEQQICEACKDCTNAPATCAEL